MSKLTITIKDISEGKGEAFAAVIHELNDAVAMGDDMNELFEGIKLAIDTAEEDGISIFKKPARKVVIKKINYIKPVRLLGADISQKT